MKKSKLVNIVLIIIIGMVILLTTRETLAANNIINITAITGNNTSNTEGNTTGNNTANNTVNNITANKTNNVLTTNNTSNYNNSSLPKTGIGDTVSGVVLVVILGISAIYAYNKIQYYKNI